MNFFTESYVTLNGQSENEVNSPYFLGNKGRTGQIGSISASRHVKDKSGSFDTTDSPS